MSIRFPVVPNVPGVPALAMFPGAETIIASINGNVATINAGVGAISNGLSLSGSGIALGTQLVSGLTSITPDGIGSALVNISQSVPSVSTLLSGSLAGLLPDIGGLLGGDSVDALLGSGDALWGVFKDGIPVILADSFISIEYKKDWHISDYPVEQGNFESYNKVLLPYDVKIVMTKGGPSADLADFMNELNVVAASLDLYDVVTPEASYSNANIIHIDYRRNATNGVSLVTFAIWLQEVRVTATSTFVNTATPSGQDQVNGGNVQAQPATPAEDATFAGHGATGAF